MRKYWRLVTGVVVVLAVLLVVSAFAVFYYNSPERNIPIVYADQQMLLELWSDYKRNYLEENTNRTLDKQQDSITTSEGQSYTMLRAVWMDDQKTFDDSWQWTKDNLQRDDFLMSWKFGRLPDGNYGIQDTVGGQNTASDGNSDTALALLMAYSRWKQDKYLYDALPIISSMWEKEVVLINGKPVLVANDLERNNPERVIVNPSYFSPYAYKIFAKVDKAHDWTSLSNNSYDILIQASSENLDYNKSVGLAPDWIYIDRKTGAMSATGNPNLSTKFSFDAMRTPWRMALDYAWFKDPRAKTVLSNYKFLKDQWSETNKIAASYNRDGSAPAEYEAPAIYGGVIGYFKYIEPALAEDIYTTKLSTLYSPDEQKLKQPLSYYDDNWSWFGTALYLNALPNLTATESGE